MSFCTLIFCSCCKLCLWIRWFKVSLVSDDFKNNFLNSDGIFLNLTPHQRKHINHSYARSVLIRLEFGHHCACRWPSTCWCQVICRHSADYKVRSVSSKVSMAINYFKKHPADNIDGLVQERRNSIANALELRLSCTDPSTCYFQNGWRDLEKFLGISKGWQHVVTHIWLNIGSGSGLLPDGTKPLSEPMLNSH